MSPIFPAILIGGPPHSGKSTLTYRLSQALLNRQVQHYVLRASPDGEGNWTNEIPIRDIPALRKRAKSDWVKEFAEYVSRDVAQRHYPLIVDAGGMASDETQLIAQQCTHAVLIANELSNPEDWRHLIQQAGLVLLADLTSSLHADQKISRETPILCGTMSGLGPNLSSDGVCFDALVQRLAHICYYNPQDLYNAHIALTDFDVIHVERSIYPLPAHNGQKWEAYELPRVVASLPIGEPLGIYGRGPVWLYAALAALAYPSDCVLFDIRHGWIIPPTLALDQHEDPTRLRWDAVKEYDYMTHLQFSIPDSYLDYYELMYVPVPNVSPYLGVILDGRLPNWLWAALARTYLVQPWIAVYQPQLGQAIVIRSHDEHVPVGSLFSI
ncbi:MAG: hypothetical protein HC828_03065 [Blastochloris sp.]|nr:hypothetical protein [Blastochloris sp.]